MTMAVKSFLFVLAVAEAVAASYLPPLTESKELKPRSNEIEPTEKVSYSGAQVFVVSAEFLDVLDRLETNGDIINWFQSRERVDFVVKKENLDRVKKIFEQEGVPYEIVIEDVQVLIDLENVPVAARKHYKAHQMDWYSYHTLEEIEGYLDYLAETYPDFVTVGSFGKSVEGRPLKYLKISSGEPKAKALWIDGGIHAREWISPSTVTYIIKELTENSHRHFETLKGIDFYIVPVLNPDGYEYSHEVDRMWRKNRAILKNCQGVDLNRNWAYQWTSKDSTNAMCEEDYPGDFAFSEPETRAASDFIINIPKLMGFVTFHGFGQYIVYPYGYKNAEPAPDRDELDRVGRLMAEAVHRISGKTYVVGNSEDKLYPAAGGADDWAKAIAGAVYSYTIELPDTGEYGFVLPPHYILPAAKEGLAAIEALSFEIQKRPFKESQHL